jgi:hypothetical protein
MTRGALASPTHATLGHIHMRIWLTGPLANSIAHQTRDSFSLFFIASCEAILSCNTCSRKKNPWQSLRPDCFATKAIQTLSKSPVLNNMLYFTKLPGNQRRAVRSVPGNQRCTNAHLWGLFPANWIWTCNKLNRNIKPVPIVIWSVESWKHLTSRSYSRLLEVDYDWNKGQCHCINY